MLIKKERAIIRTNLKKARKDNNLTQAELAKLLGIATNHYQAIELGTRTGSIALWDKLEDLFGIHQRQLRNTENTPTAIGDGNQAPNKNLTK